MASYNIRKCKQVLCLSAFMSGAGGAVLSLPPAPCCRPEAGHGAGHVGHGVGEGREAPPPHDQGQPHQGPETQAHHFP